MALVIEAQIKANKREIPGNLPPGLWFEKVLEYEASSKIAHFPFYDPAMEYLAPWELARLKAKALIWWEITMALPADITYWWEVRQARKRGDVPHISREAVAFIDGEGTLHCGHCGARWSTPNDDQKRCKLCDTIIGERHDFKSG